MDAGLSRLPKNTWPKHQQHSIWLNAWTAYNDVTPDPKGDSGAESFPYFGILVKLVKFFESAKILKAMLVMYLHSTTLEDQMQSTKLLVATMEVCSECVCVCVCVIFWLKDVGKWFLVWFREKTTILHMCNSNSCFGTFWDYVLFNTIQCMIGVCVNIHTCYTVYRFFLISCSVIVSFITLFRPKLVFSLELGTWITLLFAEFINVIRPQGHW